MCSMILLNYLARKRGDSGMVAGITISVAWDAIVSSNSLEKPLNWLLFNTYLTYGLRRAVSRSDAFCAFKAGVMRGFKFFFSPTGTGRF